MQSITLESKLFLKFKTLKNLIQLSSEDKLFCSYSSGKWNEQPQDTEGELLLDLMDYDHYIFQQSYIANFFRLNYKLEPVYYHFIAREKVLLRLFFSLFRKFSRLDKLYKSFNCSFALSQKKHKYSKELANKLKFKTKHDLLDFHYEGIKIGDLIYDTYLRTYARPTVDLEDERLEKIIVNTFDIYLTCKDYLDNHNVKKIVNSHAVYIQCAILGRLALLRGIDVYNFSWDRVLHKLSIDHHLPTPRHLEYKKSFAGKKNKDELRGEAKRRLEGRLRGEIDPGIAYMKTSPYSDSNDSKKIFLDNGKPKVVMMLHCFYDAPHIYKDCLFEDFNEWVEFIFSRVEEMNVDLVVKPHPSPKPLNSVILEKLFTKYPNIRVLDKNTSNKKIIEEGVDLLLSVYGTVAHEFAYQGVKVLLGGDNPCAAYDFCKLPKNKKEFEYYLMNIEEICLDLNKKEIEEFFYMHFINDSGDRGTVTSIDGNTDLFHGFTRNYDPLNKEIFLELVRDGNSGTFDNMFPSWQKALNEVDSYV